MILRVYQGLCCKSFLPSRVMVVHGKDRITWGAASWRRMRQRRWISCVRGEWKGHWQTHTHTHPSGLLLINWTVNFIGFLCSISLRGGSSVTLGWNSNHQCSFLYLRLRLGELERGGGGSTKDIHPPNTLLHILSFPCFAEFISGRSVRVENHMVVE